MVMRNMAKNVILVMIILRERKILLIMTSRILDQFFLIRRAKNTTADKELIEMPK